ncbi:MAG: SpoIIE family protein phosphatase [Treponema sp.]|jgi:HAMP domain-containing protein|nr:SpoIIE family protein phosphatase [Treponema sp.]
MAQKWQYFKTIRMKLIVPILCAIILGALLMGYVSHRITSGIITDAAKSEGLNAARNLREIIDLVISTAELDLSAIVLQPIVKSVVRGQTPPGELEEYMRALVERYPLYNNMICLNRAGIVVAHSSDTTGRDNSDREYYKAGMAGKNYISAVEVSRSSGRVVSFISTPVFDGEEVIGVVLAGVLLQEINHRYVAPVSLLDGRGYAMIVNSSGIIISHRDEDMLGKKIPDYLYERINTLGAERTAFEAVVNDTPSMLFVERNAEADWFPVVICSISDFYTSTNYLARMNTVLTGGVILLLAVIVLLVINGITKALSTAIHYADSVSRGNLDASLSVRREDEVGVLAGALRDMVASLKAMISVAEQKSLEAQEATEKIIESINYASKIQRDLLPRNYAFDKAFTDYSIIWKPRDIVGGDIFWLKNFEQGTVLCVCDCTGHGTSGALLSMLVISALEATVQPDNCHDTAGIIWQIEQRLVTNFNVNTGERSTNEIHDGCDIAALFIAKNGSINLSSGNIHVFVCDGREVQQINGQRINVGEGLIKSKDEIQTVRINANSNNKFYIGSDGLFDQIGGPSSIPFGYKIFKQTILENHRENQEVISEKVWNAFEEYRGEEKRVDDFELISFKP